MRRISERDVELAAGATTPESLDGVWDDVWSRLLRGAQQRDHPFHTCALASIGEDGADARTVVLRHAERSTGLLGLHTDRRSAKLGQLLYDARVCLLFYGDNVQVRVRGSARIEADTARCDAVWNASGARSRINYLTAAAPGTPSATPTSGLDPRFAGASPSLEASASGRAQFALVQVEVQTIDWLQLTADGQRRAGFSRSADRWMSTWLVP